MPTSNAKTVALKSSDGKIFAVSEGVVRQLETVMMAIEDGSDNENTVVPVTMVDGRTLERILNYCEKHAEEGDEEDKKTWDAEFVNVDQAILYDMIMAANYLNIPALLHLIATKVADLIRGKSVEQIRRHFNIENDFTPEEEEKIREENSWAFQ